MVHTAEGERQDIKHPVSVTKTNWGQRWKDQQAKSCSSSAGTPVSGAQPANCQETVTHNQRTSVLLWLRDRQLVQAKRVGAGETFCRNLRKRGTCQSTQQSSDKTPDCDQQGEAVLMIGRHYITTRSRSISPKWDDLNRRRGSKVMLRGRIGGCWHTSAVAGGLAASSPLTWHVVLRFAGAGRDHVQDLGRASVRRAVGPLRDDAGWLRLLRAGGVCSFVLVGAFSLCCSAVRAPESCRNKN